MDGSSSKIVDWFFSVIGLSLWWTAAAELTTLMTLSPLGIVEVKLSLVFICAWALGGILEFLDYNNFLELVALELSTGYLYLFYSSTSNAVYNILCAICNAIFGYSIGYSLSRWMNLRRMTSCLKVTSIFKVRFSSSEVCDNHGKTIVGFNKLPPCSSILESFREAPPAVNF